MEKKIRELLDLKIFIESSNEICKKRRLKRIPKAKENDKARMLEEKRWDEVISPQWDKHLESTREYADIIYTGNKKNIEEEIKKLS